MEPAARQTADLPELWKRVRELSANRSARRADGSFDWSAVDVRSLEERDRRIRVVTPWAPGSELAKVADRMCGEIAGLARGLGADAVGIEGGGEVLASCRVPD